MLRTITVGTAATDSHRSIRAALKDLDADEIVVRPGTYVEHLVIEPRERPLLIRSASGDPTDTELTFGLCQGDRDETGMEFIQRCATLSVLGDDVSIEGMTISNSFDRALHPGRPNLQAIALRTLGTRIRIRGCRILGQQDTLLLDAASWSQQQYVHVQDCEIAGDVDFVYGRATALIEGGTIRSVGPGYVAAPSTALENPRGFLFHDVDLVPDPAADLPPGSVRLGRPWHPGGKPDASGNAVFANCRLGSHINAEPWEEMGGFAWQDARLGEWMTTGPGSEGVARPQWTGIGDPRDWLDGWDRSTPAAPSIVIVGDSTSCDYPQDRSPRTGWGQALRMMVDLPVRNHAQSGASTRSFIAEGLLPPALEDLEPGSLLLIAFGHNDSKPDERFTSPFTEFQAMLRRYVLGARARGAVPVLITPVARRHFDDDGVLRRTHHPYDERIRVLAEDEDVPLVDLTVLSEELLETLGDDASRPLFMWLDPDPGSNYPAGEKDDTHLSAEGAVRIAGLVLLGLQDQALLGGLTSDRMTTGGSVSPSGRTTP